MLLIISGKPISEDIVVNHRQVASDEKDMPEEQLQMYTSIEISKIKSDL